MKARAAAIFVLMLLVAACAIAQDQGQGQGKNKGPQLRTVAGQIVDKDALNHVRGAPLSIALLGLIPLGVGLAYLAFYLSDPARRIGAS